MMPQSLKARLKTLLLWKTGLLARREARQSGACILMYHGVVPAITDPELDRYAIAAADFTAHLQYLRRYCVPIPLSELIDALRSGAAVDPRWVVLTLDDALRNQTELARRILADFRMPWCLAVPSGLIDSGRTVWSYELTFLLLHCWKQRQLPAALALGEPLPTETRGQRVRALAALRERLARQGVNPADFATRLIDAVGAEGFREQLEADGRYSLASWARLRELAESGVEMVVHGHRHLPQNEARTPAERHEEFVAARDLLQRQLGRRPSGFAFPHGVTCPAAFEALERAGYEFALTSRSARVTPSGPPWRLPRFHAELDLPGLRRCLLTT